MDIDRNLLARWQQYHREFIDGSASRETVLAAYNDWVSAVDSERQSAFDAREGGKLLLSIGIKINTPMRKPE